MERAYSGFGASYICHLLTYLDTYPPTYSPGSLDPHSGVMYSTLQCTVCVVTASVRQTTKQAHIHSNTTTGVAGEQCTPL